MAGLLRIKVGGPCNLLLSKQLVDKLLLWVMREQPGLVYAMMHLVPRQFQILFGGDFKNKMFA